jgi:hypothetical protein
MESNSQRILLIEKIYDAALKFKLSQLAREYDPNLVFELWTQFARTDGVKTCFSKRGWNPDMTITEALDRLDDFGLALEDLLRKGQLVPENKEGSLLI